MGPTNLAMGASSGGTDAPLGRSWPERYSSLAATTGTASKGGIMRILIAAFFAVANITFAQRPSQAAEAPWCLITAAGCERCHYTSLDDCLRDRVGGGGFCNPNPRYHGTERPPRRGRRHLQRGRRG
jgi:hypothetical protein